MPEGTSKRQLLFLTKKHTSGQRHKAGTAPGPFPGIAAFCLDNPRHSGNPQNRAASARLTKSLCRTGVFERPVLDPQGKNSTEPVTLWTSDSASGIYSLGRTSDTAVLTDIEVK